MASLYHFISLTPRACRKWEGQELLNCEVNFDVILSFEVNFEVDSKLSCIVERRKQRGGNEAGYAHPTAALRTTSDELLVSRRYCLRLLLKLDAYLSKIDHFVL